MNEFAEYNYLCHYGVLGMKWGVRRFQNKDGSLTAAGRVRYGGENAEKYRSKLLKKAQKMNKNGKYDTAIRNIKNASNDEMAIQRYREKDKRAAGGVGGAVAGAGTFTIGKNLAADLSNRRRNNYIKSQMLDLEKLGYSKEFLSKQPGVRMTADSYNDWILKELNGFKYNRPTVISLASDINIGAVTGALAGMSVSTNAFRKNLIKNYNSMLVSDIPKAPKKSASSKDLGPHPADVYKEAAKEAEKTFDKWLGFDSKELTPKDRASLLDQYIYEEIYDKVEERMSK